MKLATLAIAAALVAGCKVNEEQSSFLVGTKLIPATITSATSGCVYDATGAENVFGFFDPAFGYRHALVVQNQLPNNAAAGPGRINTNDFQVKGATIKTEVLVGPPQSIPDQVVPANGLIRVGETAPVAIALAQANTIQDGSDVRFHIQVFGNLQDGSSVKSQFYVYAAHAQTGFVQGALCTATQTAFFCEGVDASGVAHQDTGSFCQ